MEEKLEAKHDRRTFLTSVGGGTAIAAVLKSGTSQGAREATARCATGSGDDLCFVSAKELATLIRTKKVSAREVMAAHLQRINRVNPKINAIVAKLDDQQCLALAEAADQRSARKEQL